MPQLTPRIVAVTAREEAVVTQAYLDTANPPVWTWSMGLTAAAGVDVKKYKDKPASLGECLLAAVSVMKARYLPAVLKAFAGTTLNDAQLAAALSFHWHTGAIGRADWVKNWRLEQRDQSRKSLVSNYLGGGSFLQRRQREASLFFDNVWPTDYGVLVYDGVLKPSYRPTKARRVDIIPVLQQIMGGQ